jgi:hypothetical protein
VSIVEFSGGRINHRYLMRKKKYELVRMYEVNRHSREFINGLLSAEDLRAMNKQSVATEILRQFDRMVPSVSGAAA